MTDAGDPIVEAIDLLAPALEREGLDEIELEIGDLHVRVARPLGVVATGPVAGVAAAAPALPAPSPGSGDGLTPFGAPAPGMRFVSAPLTGVWYPAPSPGARPYVNEGDEVAAGQVIGLIEAMKLFNEIKSDRAGRVVRIYPDDGALVKAKQPLIEVEPA